MSNKSLIVKLVVLIVLLFVVIGCCGLVYINFKGEEWFSADGFVKMDTIKEEEYNPNDIKGFDIDCLSTDIVITKSDSDKVSVVFKSTKNAEQTDISLTSDGKVKVKQENASGFNFFMLKKSRLEISIPESVKVPAIINIKSGNIKSEADFTDIKTNQTSGNTEISGNISDNVDLNTTSGNILNKANSTKCDMQSTSGNIVMTGYADYVTLNSSSGNIESQKSAVEITAQASSGNIKLAADKNTKKLNADCKSGNIKLIFLNIDSYSVNAQIGSGYLDDEIKGKRYHDDTEYFVNNADGMTVNAGVKSGNIKIEKSAE